MEISIFCGISIEFVQFYYADSLRIVKQEIFNHFDF